MLNVLDLFSGIGGFSLGLERTGGFKTAAFCEIDRYCQAILRKHWPEVPIFWDVKGLSADILGPLGRVDVICGGFPCQDISFAGKGAGITGERSGLWGEYARLISELRPSYAIVENVSALLVRGLGRVLGDLAAFGYDAEWHCIPASAVGAPHIRDRLWLVAYPASSDAWGHARFAESLKSLIGKSAQLLPDASGNGIADQSEAVADSEINRRIARWPGDASQEQRGRESDRGSLGQDDVADASSGSEQRGGAQRDVGNVEEEILRGGWHSHNWDTEPDVGRVANGIPSRVDRLRALGNAVVPQIVEIIGRAILEAERGEVV